MLGWYRTWSFTRQGSESWREAEGSDIKTLSKETVCPFTYQMDDEKSVLVVALFITRDLRAFYRATGGTSAVAAVPVLGTAS